MLISMSKRISAHHLRQLSRDINPDEIFLDSKNLPSYDKDQFEGRIEKSISRGAIFGVFLSFLLIIFIFLAKVTNLQFAHGEEFLVKSENNRLDHTPLFAMRGVIYDRNKVPRRSSCRIRVRQRRRHHFLIVRISPRRDSGMHSGM